MDIRTFSAALLASLCLFVSPPRQTSAGHTASCYTGFNPDAADAHPFLGAADLLRRTKITKEHEVTLRPPLKNLQMLQTASLLLSE